MKRVILAILFAAVALSAAASAATLKQFVGDCRTGNALEGAAVRAGGHSDATDQYGFAYLYISPGTYDESISAAGYSPTSQGAVVRDYGQNYYTACLNPISYDSTAPRITVDRTPTAPTSSGIITITAAATDASGVSWTRIKYRLGMGQWQASSCTGDYCLAAIGPLNSGTAVSYYAEASDENGNVATSTTASFQVSASANQQGSGNNGGTTSFASTDSFGPTIGMIRTPSTVTELDDAIITANAFDLSGVQSTEIHYRLSTAASWTTVHCNGATCSAAIYPLNIGAQVQYYATATDNSPNHNGGTTATSSYVVVSSGTNPPANTGTLRARAYNCNTGAALPSATLTFSGMTAITDSNGNAIFNNVPATTGTLSLTGYWYNPASKTVTVTAGVTTTESICTTPSSTDSTPPIVSITRSPSGAVQAGQTVTFTASATDASGIAWTQAVYQVNGGAVQTRTCFTSTCTITTGPYDAGATVTYHANARDASPWGNTASTPAASFTVEGGNPTPTPTPTATPNPSPTPAPQTCAVVMDTITPVNQATTAQVNYFGTAAPNFASINCGNGQQANALCTTGNGATTCTTACTYATTGNYAVSATAGGSTCTGSSINVVSVPTNRGALFIIAQDAATGARIQGALATAGTYAEYADSFGEARFDLLPGTYSANVSATGYSAATARNVTVAAGMPTVAVFRLDKTSLGQNECDFDFTISAQPTCSQANHEQFTLILTNKVNASLNVALNHSSSGTLTPVTATLAPYGQNTVGGDFAIDVATDSQPPIPITARSASCQSTIYVPSCTQRGVQLALSNDNLDAAAGSTACTQATVKNLEAGEQLVSLGYSGNYPATFSAQRFVLGGYEQKAVDYCISLPSTADGTSSFRITATTPTGSDDDLLTLNAHGQGAFRLSHAYCALTSTSTANTYAEISASDYVPVTQYLSINPSTTNYASICLNPSGGSTSDNNAPTTEVILVPSSAYQDEQMKIIAVASDYSNVANTRVYYRVNGDAFQSATCSGSTCSIVANGFTSGDTITYYAWAEDSSSSRNAGETTRQTTTVSGVRGGDRTAPTLSVSRNPSGLTSDDDYITITASASDDNGIRRIDVYYKVGTNPWTSRECIASSCTVNVGQLAKGTQVSYYATATDNSAEANTWASDPASFIVSSGTLPSGTYVGGVDVEIIDCNSRDPVSSARVRINSNDVYTDVNGIARIQPGTLGASTVDACGCAPLQPTDAYVLPITLESITAQSGDYRVELSAGDEGLQAAVEQPLLYDFITGTKRSAYVDVRASDLLAGRHTVALGVRPAGGSTMFVNNLCFDVPKTTSTIATIAPNGLVMPAGAVVTTWLVIENKGNGPLTYSAVSGSNIVAVEPSGANTTVQAGERAKVKLTITTTTRTPFASYSVPIDVYAATASGTVLVGSPRLEFTVMSQADYNARTVLSGIGISLPEAYLPTTGRAMVPVTLQNNNFHSEEVTLYPTSLPPGVTARPVTGIELAPLEEKVIFLTLTSSNAPKGVFLAQLKADSADESTTVPMHVRIAVPAQLYVNIRIYSIEYSFASAHANATIGVRNLEQLPVEVALRADGLPQGWTQRALPAMQQIPPTAEANYTLLLDTEGDARDFNATLYAETADNRRAETRIEIKAATAAENAGWLTGFFTLGFSDVFWLVLFVLMLLLALAFFLVARDNERRASKTQENEQTA